jgi:glutamate-ammonia-ligase adenylyltransferase
MAALRALRDAEIIPDSIRDDLAAAYSFLRAVEHRLQIVQESQTHTLPDSAAEMEISARRLGFGSVEDLNAQLVRHRDRVHQIYRDLFEHREGAGNFEARQFYRLLSDDMPEPEALAYLGKFGLRDPASALAVIRSLAGLTSGAQAPSAARNVLANLLAVLMPRIAGCARPEQVLIRFEQVATRSGNATLLFRSLLEDEALRDIVVQVLDAGDLPAQRLIRYPELLDSLASPSPDAATLRPGFGAALDELESLDRAARMDRIRRLKQLEECKVLVDWLTERGSDPLQALQEKLTLLADACVERAAVWDMREPSSSDPWVIVALGKLGGVELTVHSDLDLVVVYDGDPEDSATFERYQTSVELFQAFLEKPTDEGVAYKIDMRLRPEGGKGALATPFVMFRRYLETRAEIWERMAWTRCRVVSAVTGFVYGPWDPQIPGYVDYVRGRMERELARESEQRVDFKVGRGGLADVDFALQLIQIREGRERPEFRRRGTRALLADLPSTPYLNGDEVEQLRDAYGFLRRLETFARMDVDSNISWIDPHAETLNPLAIRMGLSERPGERLLQRYVETTARVRSIYKAVLARLAH